VVWKKSAFLPLANVVGGGCTHWVSATMREPEIQWVRRGCARCFPVE
jgi:hypothetical protein